MLALPAAAIAAATLPFVLRRSGRRVRIVRIAVTALLLISALLFVAFITGT